MQIESFDGQQEGEKIIKVWRAHAWVLSRAGFIFALFIIVGSLPAAFFSPSWGTKFLIFVSAIGAIYLILQVYLYINTIYILTSERVLSINQSRFLVRSINEVPLQNIQNVAHTRKGLTQMLMDYGTVEIQTSGSAVAMQIKNIAHPYLVQQKIFDAEKRSREKE